jgi:hypothetical protein
MKHFITYTFILLALLLNSCKKDEAIPEPKKPFTKSKITGVSQKGPFLNGSSLTVFELDENFAQTGKSFNTQILDNMGSFELNDLNLQTPYAKLRADGFYFNEITNQNSASPITLYALSDLSDKNSVNVNLLSTLEVTRVQYLISNGSAFSAAKQQAQEEILRMFFISKPGMDESESLDISVNTDDNAILLATSLILQGYRNESELSQLLGDIATDIRTDGVLNSSLLGSALINDARLFDLSVIRNNIENKYAAFGVSVVIPAFENYIDQFLDSANYNISNHVTCPPSGLYGINILSDVDSVYTLASYYTLAIDVPNGVTVKITGTQSSAGGVAFNVGSFNDFTFDFTGSPSSWSLQSYNSGLLYGQVLLDAVGFVTINIYENGSLVPIRTKTLYIQ